MSRNFVPAVLAAALFAAPLDAVRQEPNGYDDTRRFRADSMPWVAGERLEFRIKFGLFNVGTARLEVPGLDTIRGIPVWRGLFTIQGGVLGWDLVDTMQTWFGAGDMITRRFVHNSNENGRIRQRSYEFFPERGVYVTNHGDTLATVLSPLDDASFFFYTRTLPLEVGRTYTIPRYFVRDRNPVVIRVLRKQTISVSAGRFDCIVVQPVFRSRGMFGEGGEAYIWFSDDAARIPVRIRGTMAVGTIDMSLRSRR